MAPACVCSDELARWLTALSRHRRTGSWRQTGSRRRCDRASAAATNRLAGLMSDAVEFAEVTQLFERWLTGRPLAERSRREYARNVRAYCAWLAETPDRGGWQGDPLTDPLARDFRRYLQVEKRAAASTVNLALASLDALYRCLGLGRPHVRRGKPVQAAPCAVDEAGQRRLLRAAEAAPVRARALVMLCCSPRCGSPRRSRSTRRRPDHRAQGRACRRRQGRDPARGAAERARASGT